MGNRCNDCNKFVGLETADLEVNSLEAELSAGAIRVTASLHAPRNCAECSTELKYLDLELEEEINTEELPKFDGWADLGADDQAELAKAMNEDDSLLEIEVGESGTAHEEGGGGRYKKNLITASIDYELSLTLSRGDKEPIEVHIAKQLSEENAASQYEES